MLGTGYKEDLLHRGVFDTPSFTSTSSRLCFSSSNRCCVSAGCAECSELVTRRIFFTAGFLILPASRPLPVDSASVHPTAVVSPPAAPNARNWLQGGSSSPRGF